MPYDNSRVKLTQPTDGSDYINASWITNESILSKLAVSFIASQGPTDITSPHFLQMIYENKVDVIVMLTKCIEQSGKGILTHINVKLYSLCYYFNIYPNI